MTAETDPGIVHIGLGNFHRAYGRLSGRPLRHGLDHDWAILGAGVREGDARMRDALKGQDCLSTVIELDPKGKSARRIGSMIDFLPVEAGQRRPDRGNGAARKSASSA
jgi:mannitol 2-dehydrogenase